MRMFSCIFALMISMLVFAADEEEALFEQETEPVCATASLGRSRAITIVLGITGISIGALMAGAGCLSTPAVPYLCVGGIVTGSVFGFIFIVGTSIVGCCQLYNAKIKELDAPPLNSE